MKEQLTQEEVRKFNAYVATLGPDKRAEKDRILALWRTGGEAFISFVKNLK